LYKLVGFIAFVAVIGLSITACPEDEENGGSLTITGLSEYNGKYAIAQGTTTGGDQIIAAESIGKGGKISDGKVTLNVFTPSSSGQPVNFTGNGAEVLTVGIFNSESSGEPVATGTLSVTFKDGSAEGAASNFTSD
jgi:hypothetical protein